MVLPALSRPRRRMEYSNEYLVSKVEQVIKQGVIVPSLLVA